MFRTGLGKGQWVTESLVGIQPSKPGDQTEFAVPKVAPVEPTPAATAPPTPVVPTEKPKPVVAKKPIKDLPLTTPHGVTIFRYEEYAPGKWRYLGEFPAEATEDAKPAKQRTID